jgi:hypothetical protein
MCKNNNHNIQESWKSSLKENSWENNFSQEHLPGTFPMRYL